MAILRDQDNGNLDLILDVELQVVMRFGQRLMALRELLNLNSGTVFELDRQIDEPVELLLDGKVIAYGEAVVIDGNYGFRVTNVPSVALSGAVSKTTEYDTPGGNRPDETA